MTYEPSDFPEVEGNEELADFLWKEFQKLSAALLEVDGILLPELNVEPNKPRDGQIVLADGTNWNPGSGAGFYGRSAGSWVKLG
jgi:hypothetical protein